MTKEFYKITAEEVSNAAIKNKMLAQYNNYFRHWRDFTVLNAGFAILGLILTISEWEATFTSEFRTPRDPTTFLYYNKLSNSIQSFIVGTTAISIVTCFTKHATKQLWQEYKHPLCYYKKLVLKQV